MLLLAALLVVFTPLLSLPTFHKGVFFQAEPTAIGLSLALAIAALALALRTQLLADVPVRTPYSFLIAGAFALLSLMLAPFHQHGARSLTGSLEFGDGAIYFLWLTVSIAAGYSLFRFRLARWLLAGGMLAMLLFLLVTKACMSQLPGWQILGFSDYLALYLVPVAFVYLALSRSWCVRAKLIGMLLTGGLMLCLASLSDSRASYVVLLIILLAWLFFSLARRRWPSRRPLASIAVVVVSAMVGSFVVVWYIGQQASPEGITKLPAAVQSIWARYQLARVVMTALSSDGSAWLTGLGWGSFRDFLVLYGPGQEGVQFVFSNKGVVVTNWDSLNRLAGHSHSLYLESLLAIGVWGPVLWAIFLCSLARAIRGSAASTVLALLLGQIFLTSIWFLLPMVLGFFGLATGMPLAAFDVDEQPRDEKVSSAAFPSRMVTVIVYVVISVVLFTVSTYAWSKASYGERLMASDSTPDSRGADGGCGDIRSVPGEGEYIGRALLSVASLLGVQHPALSATTEPLEQQAQIEITRDWFARLTCISAADLDSAPSHFLRYARLQSRYVLSVSGHTGAEDPRMQEFWRRWPDELEAFAQLGSTREELVLAYVTRLYEYGEASDILAFCDPDLNQVGRGAACRLFRGMVLAENEHSRQQGQRAIRAAIDAGIEKFLVLPPSFREKYL